MRKSVNITEIDGIRYIVVDGEGFDWGLDEKTFEAAQAAIRTDPERRAVFLGDIQKHFVDCFSQFIGKEVTLNDINLALEQGYIECS